MSEKVNPGIQRLMEVEQIVRNQSNTPKGGFMDKYRKRFGPETTYESVPTSYVLSSNGFLYLDGKPIRKVR